MEWIVTVVCGASGVGKSCVARPFDDVLTRVERALVDGCEV